MLRCLAARERNGHTGRKAALPEETLATYAGNYAHGDLAALPDTSDAARNRLSRMVKRGWVKVPLYEEQCTRRQGCESSWSQRPCCSPQRAWRPALQE